MFDKDLVFGLIHRPGRFFLPVEPRMETLLPSTSGQRFQNLIKIK